MTATAVPGRIRPAALGHASIIALADLVAAGYGVAGALAALPTRSLPGRMSLVIESHVATLKAGARIDRVLDDLGLEITASAIRGQQRTSADLERALRADAESRTALYDSRKQMRTRVLGYALFIFGITALALFLALVVLPEQIADLSDELPAGELPPALARFEAFRNQWFMVGGLVLLAPLGLCLLYAGWLGRERLASFLHELRLYVPFLRSHALHAARARVLESLLFEQTAGIAANATVRRAAEREPVPTLREALLLAANRLDAGDPFTACLRETLLDTGFISDLASVSARGARTTEGWRVAAGIHREGAFKSLRRGVLASSVLVLVPTFLYTAVLLQAALVSSTVAELKGTQLMMDRTIDNINTRLTGDDER